MASEMATCRCASSAALTSAHARVNQSSRTPAAAAAWSASRARGTRIRSRAAGSSRSSPPAVSTPGPPSPAASTPGPPSPAVSSPSAAFGARPPAASSPAIAPHNSRQAAPALAAAACFLQAACEVWISSEMCSRWSMAAWYARRLCLTAASACSTPARSSTKFASSTATTVKRRHSDSKPCTARVSASSASISEGRSGSGTSPAGTGGAAPAAPLSEQALFVSAPPVLALFVSAPPVLALFVSAPPVLALFVSAAGNGSAC
eukprot:scaffold11368_cov65-Isochrysis_galbana.AAC.1